MDGRGLIHDACSRFENVLACSFGIDQASQVPRYVAGEGASVALKAVVVLANQLGREDIHF